MSDKANAMRHGHDLWQRVFKLVAGEYPAIESRHLYVDVLTMEMVRAPEQFQFIVTNNLVGDIVSDLGASQGGRGPRRAATSIWGASAFDRTAPRSIAGGGMRTRSPRSSPSA
jgi:3-isopropylmalate dehydrogenase